MRVEKVINNNVVSTKDENSREVVVMGKGLGFKAKRGDMIREDRIEKIFHMESQSSVDKFKVLLEKMPLEHIQVTSKIVEHAKKVLNKKLNPNIYITLTDHINFAVERYRQGMMFQNPLELEVKNFYRQEYLIGKYAVDLIGKELKVALSVDEVVSIALHIVNAEYNTQMSEAIHITKCIPEILDIVEEYFNIRLDKESLHYERFVTHLKFLTQRIVKKELLDNKDKEFEEAIERLYPREFKCAREVKGYIEEHFEYQITEEELAYLTVHIRRVILADQ
jgi:beta-glucoside operon transcriptional antiterminator